MQRFIDVQSLARVKDLALLGKLVAEGLLHGRHASVQKGSGMEFNQYRSYEPGDPLNRIDWKLFARSDRYFVREAERESELEIWFFVDNSASMQVVSEWKPAEKAISKLDYARFLVSTLSYIGYRQGDRIGLGALAQDNALLVRAHAGERHWHRLVHSLNQFSQGTGFPTVDAWRPLQECIQRPALIVVISDFYQQDNEITSMLKQLTLGGSDVIAMQLNCNDEITFPYQGNVEFEDAESGQRRLVSAEVVKQEYYQRREDYQIFLRQQLTDLGIELHQFDIDAPLDKAIVSFLNHRLKLAQ